MDKLVIEGGRTLSGTVAISGAKNAALPILMATLLAPGKHLIDNVPDLMDISSTLSLLGRIGCPSLISQTAEVGSVSAGGRRVQLDTSRIAFSEAPYDLVRKMRASVLALGPLLARCGEAKVSLPGGCAIGVRPIDQHLKGLEALGCEFELSGGYVNGRAERLIGAEIHLDVPTVTGTENILMAAVLAEGVSRIHNAAREPEIVDLVCFLRAMGARIQGEGTSTLVVDGVPALRPSRVPYSILPDRIEAGTYLLAGAVSGGDIRLTGVRPSDLDSVLAHLEQVGCDLEVSDNEIRIQRKGPIRAVSVETAPHPGFPTDMQAQWMALMLCSDGESVITERIFENRFMHAAELLRMGADVELNGNQARIRGVKDLRGAAVMATDLRASASLVLAGLAAKGQTEVSRIYHLDRGYERLHSKLTALGARIARVSDHISLPVGGTWPGDERPADQSNA